MQAEEGNGFENVIYKCDLLLLGWILYLFHSTF